MHLHLHIKTQDNVNDSLDRLAALACLLNSRTGVDCQTRGPMSLLLEDAGQVPALHHALIALMDPNSCSSAAKGQHLGPCCTTSIAAEISLAVSEEEGNHDVVTT